MSPQRPGRLRMLWFAMAVVALIGGLWWTLLRGGETIETVVLERGDIESSVTALGTLQPYSYVDVGAQVSGQIGRIAVQPGSVVTKGELMIEIDPALQQSRVDADRAALASLRAQLSEQQAQRDLAQRQFARQQQMFAYDSTRLEDVEIAEATLRVALARMDNFKAQIDGAQSTLKGDEALLGYTRIFAPMSGTVVTLDAREGQTLNAVYQTPTLLRIADLSRMTVWTDVSEADVRRVKPGMQAYFTTLGSQTEDGPRRWTGTVRQILPAPPNVSASAASGQAGATASPSAGKVVLYTVQFDVDNADGELMPQMSAQVFFIAAGASNVLVAPLPALTAVAGRPGIYAGKVLVAGHIENREVRIGVRDRLHAEVLSGLAQGEQLVTGIRPRNAGQGRFRW